MTQQRTRIELKFSQTLFIGGSYIKIVINKTLSFECKFKTVRVPFHDARNFTQTFPKRTPFSRGYFAREILEWEKNSSRASKTSNSTKKSHAFKWINAEENFVSSEGDRYWNIIYELVEGRERARSRRRERDTYIYLSRLTGVSMLFGAYLFARGRSGRRACAPSAMYTRAHE